MNDQCLQVEQVIEKHAHKEVHQKVKDITNVKKSNVSSGVIKNKDGKLCYEKENIMERWDEYLCKKLCVDADRPDTIVDH